MREPPDLDGEAILECVRGAYGLHPREIAFLPLGADPDTAVYRVTTGDGGAYFLKLRRGPFDEASVAVPAWLGEQGMAQVIPPLPTVAGPRWTTLRDYALVLSPFVEGVDGYAVPLSEAQQVELGVTVRRIHRTRLPPPLARRVPHDALTPAWRQALGGFLTRAGREWHAGDPEAAPLAALLWTERDRISRTVDRAEHLAGTLRATPRPAVLCHGDLHAGNVHLEPGGALRVIDWDTLVYAPRERDFEQIGWAWGGERGWERFFEGYGAITPDPVALAYYRYRRILEDLVVACQQVLATREGGANRAWELDNVRRTLRPGGTLESVARLDGR